MQIKTTLRFHLTPVRMTETIKETVGKRENVPLLVEEQTCTFTMKITMSVPRGVVKRSCQNPTTLLLR